MVRLNKELHFNEALEMFNNIQVATQVAKDLCELYGIEYDENEGRKVRGWLEDYTVNKFPENYTPKILVWDIETSQSIFKAWWTGKQYLGTRNMIKEPQILTVAYKYLGEDKIYNITWENKSDESLVKKFIKIYNDADIVIGVNSINFDSRWLNARAAKYGLEINTFVKSFDIQKEAKRVFRIPGYSMSFMCEYFGVPTQKYKHSGITMWDMIENTNNEYSKAESKEAMQEMVKYNEIDVLATEDLYYRLRPYFKHTSHLGTLVGKSKASCPDCGGKNIKLYKTTTTEAGTIQRIMICKHDDIKFKISNTEYLKWVNEK
jgi:DNA polymerase elongation subunit (family B)